MEAIERLFGLDNPFILVILFLVAIKFVIELVSYFWELGKKKYKEQFDSENEKAEESENIKELQSEVEHIKEIQAHDRERTFQIQKELIAGQNKLNDSIAPLLVEHKQVMESLTYLSNASKETLASKINEKYKEYMSKGYVPEDEFGEFVNLHDAYKKLGGNHYGDIKFNRCMKLDKKRDNEYGDIEEESKHEQ